MNRMPNTAESAASLLGALDDGQYDTLRELPDHSVAAIGKLIYTTALYLGLDEVGYRRRYCYDDDARARTEFDKLQTQDDEPQGWIAKRP